ncbi:hypothetical protein ACFOEE_01525 [Pseudoalteromonas fenneropenaei]|uniref:Solute-binding protein family 3/N-terminal domain-containing protein n=1 Tax=Pseudoalteromonas fenneropenaei TaxID=1737459 RepID=A0ABV7CF45_9GAMM
MDFPPYYFVSDQLTGSGRDEAVITLLNKRISSFDTEELLLPASRAVPTLKDTSKLRCILSLYRTAEREQFTTFSRQFSTIGLPITVAMRRQTRAQLGLQHTPSVSLMALMNDTEHTLGVAMNRSYGNAIDTVIKNTSPTVVVTRAGSDALASLTAMLLKERVDFVLGYASEHFYAKQQLDKDDQLIQLTLTEAPDFVYGYVGCSQTADTKEYIYLVDEVLEHLHDSQAFHDIMLRWLPAELRAKLATQFSPQSH